MWFVGIDLSSAFSREPRQVDLALLDDELRCTFCQAIWPPATEVLRRDRNALIGMLAPLVPGALEGQVWAIDGPQGVAETGNDARRCERVLRTPGRTPSVAPSHESTLPFAGYIRSSVDLFAALLKEPRFRLAGLNGGQIGRANLFEVFPGAEWDILAGGKLPEKDSVTGRLRRRDALDQLASLGPRFATGTGGLNS